MPTGWTRLVHNGRVLYSSPPNPTPVRIYSRAELETHQRKGRFLEVQADQLVFSRKRKQKEKKFIAAKKNIDEENAGQGQDKWMENFKKYECVKDFVQCNQEEAIHSPGDDSLMSEASHVDPLARKEVVGGDLQVNSNEMMKPAAVTVKEISSSERAKLEQEHQKLSDAVQKLTIDPKRAVDHQSVLEGVAKRLNQARVESIKDNNVDMEALKEVIKDCDSEDQVTKVLWESPWIQSKFSSLFRSKLLEEMISMRYASGNPLISFPPDINTNIYADIVNFALDHAKEMILLLTSLTKKHESPISTQDIIRLAFTFSTLAQAASPPNNALKKTKSVSLRSSGLTNSGLDSLACAGISETSRSHRNNRDQMASISEEILKQYAKKNVAQFVFDNLDFQLNKMNHHMTLNLLEFEQNDTSELPTDCKSREEMLEFFGKETVLLTSDENKDMLEHFEFVTAVTLGELFAKEIDGMQWLSTVLPSHYKHPNSETSRNKSLIHVDKPMYLHETKNSDMFKILDTLQLQYLHLIGEQAQDRDKYFEDLKLILSVECDNDEREAAEERVKKEEVKAGVLICHGDYLTYERFESCKRLKQGSTSAFERYEFMPIFRIGMFHLRLNKTIQDYGCGMPVEVNIEDELSLGYFRTILGLNHISNNAENIKRCGEFERHDNFLLEVGKEILINGFKTFLTTYTAYSPRTTEGAKNLIMKFLKKADIKFFYDPDDFEEKVKFDDCLSACRNNAGRTVLSLVADKVEHEGDSFGIRAIRKVMMFYFLNRKLVQNSKYAMALLSNLVYFMGASPRTKARIDLLATCNPTGGLGKGMARDQINEHKVKVVKESLRSLHSQITDNVLSKAILGDNVLSQIQEHDDQSMLLRTSGGRSSYRYLREDQRMKIREELERVRPFDVTRKKMDHYEKMSGSVFSGLDMCRVDRFLERNKKNFMRSYPHKNRK